MASLALSIAPNVGLFPMTKPKLVHTSNHLIAYQLTIQGYETRTCCKITRDTLTTYPWCGVFYMVVVINSMTAITNQIKTIYIEKYG